MTRALLRLNHTSNSRLLSSKISSIDYLSYAIAVAELATKYTLVSPLWMKGTTKKFMIERGQRVGL
jgi:hypothetical protein